jgi:hypothetical protein
VDSINRNRWTISSEYAHLKDYISRHQFLELSDDDEVIVKTGYCEEVIETIHAFFGKLALA